MHYLLTLWNTAFSWVRILESLSRILTLWVTPPLPFLTDLFSFPWEHQWKCSRTFHWVWCLMQLLSAEDFWHTSPSMYGFCRWRVLIFSLAYISSQKGHYQCHACLRHHHLLNPICRGWWNSSCHPHQKAVEHLPMIGELCITSHPLPITLFIVRSWQQDG